MKNIYLLSLRKLDENFSCCESIKDKKENARRKYSPVVISKVTNLLLLFSRKWLPHVTSSCPPLDLIPGSKPDERHTSTISI